MIKCGLTGFSGNLGKTFTTLNNKFKYINFKGDISKKNDINKWIKESNIIWKGHCRNMPKTLSSASIVCLPSYREGLPKVLLEAASTGRPLVATDVPGCREIVSDGYNGFLVDLKFQPTQCHLKMKEAL